MRRTWLVAAAIIALLFTLQSLRRTGSGPWGVDGSYYMQVARHVAEGDGLLTSVDIYDQGLRSLPARTNIYPLWPLLLGYSARVMPLRAAATLVPRLFFIIDLLLLFALTKRISNAYYGYAGILLLGLNPSFFSSTCYPYTEGLALGTTFASLLLADTARLRGDDLYYATAGAMAAFAFLTRSQMLFAGIAIGIVLLATRTNWRSIVAFASAYTIVVLPWVIDLTTFVKPFTWRALISMYSETPGLPAFDQHVQTPNYLADRLSAFAVMFNPMSELSFVNSFGAAAFVVPIAIAYVLWRRRWTGGFLAAASALTGVLLCATLLDAHNRFFLEWLFGYRHGLPFILLLIVALAQMTGRYIHVIAALLIVASIVMNLPAAISFARTPPSDWPSPAESQLSAWLTAHDPQAIVLTTNAQVLSVASRANFRWAACGQTPDEIARVLRLVRTDYVAVYETEQQCPFVSGLDRVATPLTMFGAPPHRIMLFGVGH